MLTIFLLAVGLVALAFAGIAIKMFVQKGGQFSKSCSTVEISSGEKVGCVCGNNDHKSCINFEKHHPDSED